MCLNCHGLMIAESILYCRISFALSISNTILWFWAQEKECWQQALLVAQYHSNSTSGVTTSPCLHCEIHNHTHMCFVLLLHSIQPCWSHILLLRSTWHFPWPATDKQLHSCQHWWARNWKTHWILLCLRCQVNYNKRVTTPQVHPIGVILRSGNNGLSGAELIRRSPVDREGTRKTNSKGRFVWL